MSFQLLDYQRTTVDFGKRTNYALYALEPGLGKSLCALTTAIETKSKTLIIVPTYLALNWKDEIKKFYPEKNVAVLPNKKDFYRPFDDDFIIITYSFLSEAEILFEWADMVVFDECHYLKDAKTKRSEAAHRLVYENSIKRLILLTGTPILNRVYELHSLLSLLHYDPRVEESPFLQKFPTYVHFANHFSFLSEKEIYRGKRKVTIQEWSGSKNTKELQDILSKVMIRFKSEDVLNLPPSEDIHIRVSDVSDEKLLDAFNAFQAIEGNNSVVGGVKRDAAIAKAPITAEYVKNLINNGMQVVVFSDHPDASEEIGRILGCPVVTGQTPNSTRHLYASKFQKGEYDCISATVGSFSTGINLHNAYNMVFNDYPWVPGALKQAKYRIIRVGQQNKCRIHFILGSFQDQYILKKLEDKDVTIKKVLA